MSESLELAYSPCPNDTYIFAALTNGFLTDAPRVRAALHDIDALNESANSSRYAFTKISYGAIPYLTDRYRILRAGGALGRGCGPLIVARPDRVASFSQLHDPLIAIPGERTTAFLLLQLALQLRPRTRIMRFDRIVDAVATGEVDAGLLIHESRFTYQLAGLHSLLDLGAWWEEHTGAPIPLGAILARSDFDAVQARNFNEAVRRSLDFARANEQRVLPYIREHAFEMDETIMRSHIALYVNQYTDDLGTDGIAAVRELFARGKQAGILPANAEARFIE